MLFDEAEYPCEEDGTLIIGPRNRLGLPRPQLRQHGVRTRKLSQEDRDQWNFSYSHLRAMDGMMDKETRDVLYYGLTRKLFSEDDSGFLQKVGHPNPFCANIFAQFTRKMRSETDSPICVIKVIRKISENILNHVC